MSIPLRRELREAGVTFQKTATAHFKEGVSKTVSKNTHRDLQDIVVEGARCMYMGGSVCLYM